MKGTGNGAGDRAVLASPLLVALALHAWASQAYPQDAFVLCLAAAAIPLGGLIPFRVTLQRGLAFVFFLVGAAIGWAHTPELGYGPGTVPRFASLIAVGSLMAATSRFYLRGSWSGERGTFVLATLAVAASGSTRLGATYGVFAAVYLAFTVLALRWRDPARARMRNLGWRHGAALAGSIVVGSAIAFALTRAIVPIHDRVERAFEQAYLVHDMVGFGAGSTLGEMHDMIESDIEVLRITTPPHAPPVDYLRGAVYDAYRHDGLWLETPPALRLRDVAVDSTPAPRGTAVSIRRITGRAGRYFLPLAARDVRVASGAVEADDLGAILTVGSDHTPEYSFVVGPRDKLAPSPPRDADLDIPRSERAVLGELASTWTAGAATTEAKLDAIGSHLDRGYRYSLEIEPSVGDPLLRFLVTDRVGYCTYFATAMTMLARSSGIPARLVTGYRVGEWSPVARQYIVREKNAHAWVEAWVDGAWRTYDPTPISELPQNAAHVAELGALVADLGDRFEQGVAYAIGHVTPVQLFFALAVLVTLWATVRKLRGRAVAASQALTGDRVDLPLPCFAHLSASLARQGIVRERSESLERFARRLEDLGLGDAARLVERYAALRYGGRGEGGEREGSRLQEEMERFAGRSEPSP